jgi:hypothetical protein
LINAGQDLDKGRLSCPVVANDGEYLPFVQRQIDIGHGPQSAERFGDATHRQQRLLFAFHLHPYLAHSIVLMISTRIAPAPQAPLRTIPYSSIHHPVVGG